MQSQPTRAAWIEIAAVLAVRVVHHGRSPLGLRGLKFFQSKLFSYRHKSQPTRAAWIEITVCMPPLVDLPQSQPTRAAWIEISLNGSIGISIASQPTRAAWIEIAIKGHQSQSLVVAAHSGCVD